MDIGFEKLSDKLSALAVNDSFAVPSNDNESLFQVKNAVEAADATIRQQVLENERLKIELQRKTQEFEKYKLDMLVDQRSFATDKWDYPALHPRKSVQPVSLTDVQGNSIKHMENSNIIHPLGTVCQPDLVPEFENHSHTFSENQVGNSLMNGTMKVYPSGQNHMDHSLLSSSSPSTSVFAATRYQMEGEKDLPFNLPRPGIMTMIDVNNSNSVWKQDLVFKNREYEEEILQLQKHLSEYSTKEAQIHNEKCALEKRISYLHMTFDQQQQDLVDASSKAISYRQYIIEENIRLTYALQDAHQERTTFVSSLLPLLSEYSLQPQNPDAQSIIGNLKVLFKHLQEKLLLMETKLKDSKYQLASWNSNAILSDFAPSPPLSTSIAAAQTDSIKNTLELVPQPTYSLEKIPLTTLNTHTASGWDHFGHNGSNDGGFTANNLIINDLGRYSPLANRSSTEGDVANQIVNSRPGSRDASNKQVTFSDPVSTSPVGDLDTNGAETSTNWGSGNVVNDDLNSPFSPYLAPVLEEPSSSFSEAADDDPLPGVESLQISGEAFPGCELQASGYSTYGTSSCFFEWVRHLENGSVNYIEGAKQPIYRVTADDVNAYLAVEVQPLDNRNRKGELVKVFANEHQKIICDPKTRNLIEETVYYIGHATYRVFLPTGYLDIWEPATLAIKSEGYSIKRTSCGLVSSEKFSPSLQLSIPYGDPSEFIIFSSSGSEHLLRADSSMDGGCSRDTIVLTMRLFIMRANEKKKLKKKSLFFNR